MLNSLDQERQRQLITRRYEQISYWQMQEVGHTYVAQPALKALEVARDAGAIDGFRVVAGAWAVKAGATTTVAALFLLPVSIPIALIGITGGVTIALLGLDSFNQGFRNLAFMAAGLPEPPWDEAMHPIAEYVGESKIERYVGVGRNVRIFSLTGFLPDQAQLASLKQRLELDRAEAKRQLDRLGVGEDGVVKRHTGPDVLHDGNFRPAESIQVSPETAPPAPGDAKGGKNKPAPQRAVRAPKSALPKPAGADRNVRKPRSAPQRPTELKCTNGWPRTCFEVPRVKGKKDSPGPKKDSGTSTDKGGLKDGGKT